MTMYVYVKKSCTFRFKESKSQVEIYKLINKVQKNLSR